LADGEAELPMWEIPPPAASCAAARSRSLWFGVMPTFSGEHDADGRPRLDEHAIYQIRCVARRTVRPGHQDCPRRTYVSGPTEPFRLAAFADPEGTAKNRISITMPDFRAVAARAGRAAGPGGVSITSPPRSQMLFDPANGSPSNGEIVGTAAQTCTYALEIFMIVAMFVFSLFLPIVVFLFQLWWLLALRFCLPPQAQAMAALSAYFVADKKMADMTSAETSAFDRLLGSKGAGAALKKNPPTLPSDPDPAHPIDPGLALLAAVAPPGPDGSTGPVPESTPPDPLCQV
jgi:hypothetical protein